MRIQTLSYDSDFHAQRARDLRLLIDQPDETAERVCPGCDLRCPDCGSLSCTCICSSRCAAAPRQMSSDPEDHPVEPRIVPLVHALNALRVFTPCWSCEGHLGPGGAIARLPHVWFYARSLAYPSLVKHHLSGLQFRKVLAHEWHVRVVDWGHMLDSTFSIEPAMGGGGAAELEALQADVGLIAQGLAAGVRAAAQQFIDHMEAARPAA